MQLVRSRLVFVVLALGGTVALAQGEAPPAAPVAEAPPQEEVNEDDPAAQVPAARYLEVAQDSVGAMRTALSKGLDELKEAREKKDAVQLTCVNEQVTAMKGILR